MMGTLLLHPPQRCSCAPPVTPKGIAAISRYRPHDAEAGRALSGAAAEEEV
jgi:hypothetical protein